MIIRIDMQPIDADRLMAICPGLNRFTRSEIEMLRRRILDRETGPAAFPLWRRFRTDCSGPRVRIERQVPLKLIRLPAECMKKTLRVDIADQASTRSLALLKRLPPSSLFQPLRPRFRHPAAIYLLSLIQLAGDPRSAIANYAAIRSGQGKIDLVHRAKIPSQRILIYSIRERQ